MAVHVDEIHTDVSASPAVHGGHEATGEPGIGTAGPAGGRQGAGDEAWRTSEARVRQLRCRVAAEGFDD